MQASESTESEGTQCATEGNAPQTTGQHMLTPQGQPESCPSCSSAGSDGASQRTYVYALGTIEMRFPDISIEKEFAQVIGRTDTKGLTNTQTILKVLMQRENRFLARQICWVMSIEGLETYILLPRDPADFELLVGAVRPNPNPSDIDVVIGARGPMAPARMCNGLQVPVVAFDQIYSFDRDALIKALPKPEKVTAKEFASAAEEMFDRIQQMADNAGATDEHRALNYLAVRYPAIYALTADAFGRSSSLQSVNVLPSRLSGVRKVVDVVLSYTNRTTDVTEKFFVRVDVSDEFPFLVTKLSPYYDRQ